MATIEEAIAAIKSGDKAKGQEIIAKLLKDDRNNEMAWLWLSQTNITLEQKIKSLQNVLRINPDNEVAREGLQKLQARQPKSQPSPKTELKPEGGLLKGMEPTARPAKKAPSIAPIQDTKTCPYCAETIKAEAVVCRFCGRDLNNNPEKPSPSTPPQMVYIVNEKEPNTAGCLNVIIPGLGHIYAGNWGRGILTFIVAGILFSILFSIIAVDGGICSLPSMIIILILLFIEARQAAIKFNSRIPRN